ncbi:MAG TPA: hypothetical protein VFO74_13845 [Pseudolabrys sp.]|nr:hypothetical protein [Pseudolabrys sp.]
MKKSAKSTDPDAIKVSFADEPSSKEIENWVALLAEGAAVDTESAAAELPLAASVALARDGPDLVGLGAIKRKRPQYAASLTRKSGFQIGHDWHELGYMVVRKSHQGQGLSLLIARKLLSSFSRSTLFATTSHPNMKRTLARVGFVEQGREWPGQSGGILSLWIRPRDLT